MQDSIQRQNELNTARPNRYRVDNAVPVLPDSANIEVCVSLPAHVVEAVGNYLDAHPQMSWDDVAAMGLILVAMPNDGDTRALHAEYISLIIGRAAA